MHLDGAIRRAYVGEVAYSVVISVQTIFVEELSGNAEQEKNKNTA